MSNNKAFPLISFSIDDEKECHVLVEVSGGVVSNVMLEGNVTVWLRDYDNLREEGYTDEQAEQVPPQFLEGKLGPPPDAFTKQRTLIAEWGSGARVTACPGCGNPTSDKTGRCSVGYCAKCHNKSPHPSWGSHGG